ncbi:EXS family-domain-containing protein [Phlyctochytrium arcticum]|nr:EXS family-domain-containing protein [Phlyctochytrium arcticum]
MPREDEKSLYAIATFFTGVSAMGLIIFNMLATRWGEENAEIAPSLAFIGLLGWVVWPRNVMFARERKRFIHSLRRVVLGGLASAVPFCDVILADILTSFSKIMGDLQIVFTDLVIGGDEPPNKNVAKKQLSMLSLIPPLLIRCDMFCHPYLPFLFRLRQCLAEYTQSQSRSVRSRHLANALKYTTAFPVIAAGFAINWMMVASHEIEGFHAVYSVNRVIFSAIQSVYSLYWDIVMDWHLGNLRPANFEQKRGSASATGGQPGGIRAVTDSSRYPFFLRPMLHFRRPAIYYLAILIDTLLRMSWIVRIALLQKMIEGLVSHHPADIGTILKFDRPQEKQALLAADIALKILEILRRCVWVFFRMEREWVSRGLAANRPKSNLHVNIVSSGDAFSPGTYFGRLDTPMEQSPDSTVLWDMRGSTLPPTGIVSDTD